MKTSLIVIENLYSNPEEVRSFALEQNFETKTYVPGGRTKSFLTESLKTRLEEIILPHGGKIISFSFDCGSFNYTTTSSMSSWKHGLVHTDSIFDWAGVCYLTPNPPENSGTSILINKKLNKLDLQNNQDREQVGDDWSDLTKWDIVDTVGNKFNRLVLYRGQYAHMPMKHFGFDKYTGRLTQVFFFKTQK